MAQSAGYGVRPAGRLVMVILLFTVMLPFAADAKGPEYHPDDTYAVTTVDGAEFIGPILSHNEESVVVRTESDRKSTRLNSSHYS